MLLGAPGEKVRRVSRERGKEEAFGKSEKRGRGSPSQRRIRRRGGRGSFSRSESEEKDAEKGVFKYQRDRESKSIATKMGPKTKEQEADKSLQGEREGKVVDQENFTRNDDQQDGALENNDEDDLEEILQRNQEYFKDAALPLELEQDFDQTSQEEESENLCETPLGEKVTEDKLVEGGKSKDEVVSISGVQQESQETDDMESNPKADLNLTLSVHSSLEVEVMGDVETSVEEKEEQVEGDVATKKQFMDEETRESVEQKLKELASRRAFIMAKMDWLKEDMEVLQVSAKFYLPSFAFVQCSICPPNTCFRIQLQC